VIRRGDGLHVVTDLQGRQSMLTPTQYERHILEVHEEIDDPEIIAQTVREPDSIWKESRYPDSFVYYRLGAHPEYPTFFLRVVTRAGMVLTAYLIDKPRRRRHAPIWNRNS
jgi:hypothetical protein